MGLSSLIWKTNVLLKQAFQKKKKIQAQVLPETFDPSCFLKTTQWNSESFKKKQLNLSWKNELKFLNNIYNSFDVTLKNPFKSYIYAMFFSFNFSLSQI